MLTPPSKRKLCYAPTCQGWVQDRTDPTPAQRSPLRTEVPVVMTRAQARHRTLQNWMSLTSPTARDFGDYYIDYHETDSGGYHRVRIEKRRDLMSLTGNVVEERSGLSVFTSYAPFPGY